VHPQTTAPDTMNKCFVLHNFILQTDINQIFTTKDITDIIICDFFDVDNLRGFEYMGFNH